MTRNAVALAGSTAVTAALGFVFWGVATHLYTPDEVGRASAEVSAMSLIAAIAQLNLPRLYPRYLPQSGPRARRFILAGYLGCCIVGLLLGFGYVVSGLGHSIFRASEVSKLIFVFAVPVWAVFNVQDSVMTGLRAAVWVPVENVAFGLAKLLLIMLLIGDGAAGLFLGWTLPVVIAIAGVNYLIFRKLVPAHSAASGGSSSMPGRREIWTFVATGSFASQSTIIARSLIPLIVVAKLGASAGAYFYVPWLVASVLPVMLWSVSTSLVVESGFEPNATKVLLHRTVRVAIFMLLPAVLILLTVGPYLMRTLASHYAANGTTLLRLIALASLTNVFALLYETLVWLQGTRIWRLALVEIANSILVCVGTILLIGRFRINAAGLALLISGGVVGLVVVIPTIRGIRNLGLKSVDHR